MERDALLRDAQASHEIARMLMNETVYLQSGAYKLTGFPDGKWVILCETGHMQSYNSLHDAVMAFKEIIEK